MIEIQLISPIIGDGTEPINGSPFRPKFKDDYPEVAFQDRTGLTREQHPPAPNEQTLSAFTDDQLVVDTIVADDRYEVLFVREDGDVSGKSGSLAPLAIPPSEERTNREFVIRDKAVDELEARLLTGQEDTSTTRADVAERRINWQRERPKQGFPSTPTMELPTGTGVSTNPLYKWTLNRDADGYQLQVLDFTTDEIIIDDLVRIRGVISGYKSPTSLTPGLSYKSKVRAINAMGNSPYSQELAFRVASRTRFSISDLLNSL